VPQLKSVVGHPAFTKNPLETLREHLENKFAADVTSRTTKLKTLNQTKKKAAQKQQENAVDKGFTSMLVEKKQISPDDNFVLHLGNFGPAKSANLSFRWVQPLSRQPDQWNAYFFAFPLVDAPLPKMGFGINDIKVSDSRLLEVTSPSHIITVTPVSKQSVTVSFHESSRWIKKDLILAIKQIAHPSIPISRLNPAPLIPDMKTPSVSSNSMAFVEAVLERDDKSRHRYAVALNLYYGGLRDEQIKEFQDKEKNIC